MQVKWLVDQNIIVDTPSEELPNIIKDLGYDVSLIKSKNENIPFQETDCVVIYGTHNFVKRLPKKYYPGAFGVSDQAKCSIYMTYLPYDLLLNRDFVMTSWGDFKRRKDFWYKIYNTENIFIRPDSGTKTFAGTTILKSEWNIEVKTIDTLSSVNDESLILIAPPKEIISEYRFIIADGQVVTGSEYSWESKKSISGQIPEDAEHLASIGANQEWQLDTCYTCDICLTPNGYKIIELNSFACAGLYQCDLKKIVLNVSKAAIKEVTGI